MIWLRESMNRHTESAYSDRLLERKIRSLRLFETRYYNTLLDYFKERGQGNTFEPSEERYKAVSKMISNLWMGSGKDPTVLTSADRFEPILREIPRNRDHRIHSSNVFLLGYYIINRIKKIEPDFDFKTDDPNLVWMLTATFHDIGYAIQETEFWLNRIFEEFLGLNPKFAISIAQVMPMIYLDFMRILSAYHEGGITSLSSDLPSSRIDWIFYNEINSGLIEKNHGVLSALMLAHLLGIRQKFLAEEGKRNFRINHLPACHAIATHMLPSTRVSFVKHPFAFLLVLCDEIQDWGRSPSGKETQNTVYLRDIEVMGSRPTEIRFRVKTSKKRREKLRNILKERLYADERIRVSIRNISGKPILEIPENA